MEREAEYSGCGSSSCKLVRPTGQHNNGPCRCKQTILDLIGRVEALTEAMKPFAEYAEHFVNGSGREAWEDRHDAGYFMGYQKKPGITVGDYRRAAELLSQKG